MNTSASVFSICRVLFPGILIMLYFVFEHVTKLWSVGHKILSLSVDDFAWIVFSLL